MSTATANALVSSAIHHDNGDPEVTATWAADNIGKFRLIDVREPHELTGPLGGVPQATNIPLLELLSQTGLNPDEPLVLLCRSGRRSGLAARELTAQGVKTVASVEGGMMAWNFEVKGIETIQEVERTANTVNLSEAISTGNGIPEVTAAWVHANLGRFRMIDVREPAELASNGQVPHAVNHPLSQFLAEANGLDRAEPMVVMCASGGRSGRAIRALMAAGFKNVASMEGGMYGWRVGGFPHA